MLPGFRDAVLQGNKLSLKATVDSHALAMADMLKEVQPPEAQAAAIVRYTDAVRLFDDNTRYIMCYRTDGTRIDLAPEEHKRNGDKCLEIKDVNGVGRRRPGTGRSGQPGTQRGSGSVPAGGDLTQPDRSGYFAGPWRYASAICSGVRAVS